MGDTSPAAIIAAIREICNAEVELDGLTFLADSIAVATIRDRQEYGGIRVTLVAMLGTARISLRVDIGISDAVTPAPRIATFPTLLDFPAPRVRAYPAETVVSEEFHAMVALGIANTRMKDFYDVWLLSETRPFDGATLADALVATFARRGTQLPDDRSLALTDGFTSDPAKRAQWQAFLDRGRLRDAPADLFLIVQRTAALVLAVVRAINGAESFHASWTLVEGWGPGRTAAEDEA